MMEVEYIPVPMIIKNLGPIASYALPIINPWYRVLVANPLKVTCEPHEMELH